ncbi:Glucokinase [Hyphomicrobium sp. 1Nfss2.1]|uniref:glucokinase n=1 Tax=Hyphomicrobium sp. 1Nfss2.1 TaxID=3413936 RepID=UPI003C7C9075
MPLHLGDEFEFMTVYLVGDIGATNARFALVDAKGSLIRAADLLCRDHPTMADAIERYLASVDGAAPARAVLAVATTPRGDNVTFTNNPWAFSISELAAQLGISQLNVINDFHANALALPHLADTDVLKVGSGEPAKQAPMAVLGPGSGLGVSTAVYASSRYEAIAGEGGHVTMAPADDRESAVLSVLRKRFGHVSAERVLSGPGLVNLYRALCEIDAKAPDDLTAEDVTKAGALGACDYAGLAIDMFCAMLGTVAGNLALTLGARGGIFIAGGIVPKLGGTFARSQFRDRFEDKGRFRDYLAAIPTYVITRPHAALVGAARLLHEE